MFEHNLFHTFNWATFRRRMLDGDYYRDTKMKVPKAR